MLKGNMPEAASTGSLSQAPWGSRQSEIPALPGGHFPSLPCQGRQAPWGGAACVWFSGWVRGQQVLRGRWPALAPRRGNSQPAIRCPAPLPRTMATDSGALASVEDGPPGRPQCPSFGRRPVFWPLHSRQPSSLLCADPPGSCAAPRRLPGPAPPENGSNSVHCRLTSRSAWPGRRRARRPSPAPAPQAPGCLPSLPFAETANRGRGVGQGRRPAERRFRWAAQRAHPGTRPRTPRHRRTRRAGAPMVPGMPRGERPGAADSGDRSLLLGYQHSGRSRHRADGRSRRGEGPRPPSPHPQDAKALGWRAASARGLLPAPALGTRTPGALRAPPAPPPSPHPAPWTRAKRRALRGPSGGPRPRALPVQPGLFVWDQSPRAPLPRSAERPPGRPLAGEDSGLAFPPPRPSPGLCPALPPPMAPCPTLPGRGLLH